MDDGGSTLTVSGSARNVVQRAAPIVGESALPISENFRWSLVAGRWSLVAGVESQIGCRAIDCMCGANGCTESRLG
jgi:hypothetical protein